MKEVASREMWRLKTENRIKWKEIGWYLMVIIITIPFIFPLIWILTAAFKTQAQIIASPPLWIFKPTLNNFKSVFMEQFRGGGRLDCPLSTAGFTGRLFYLPL